MLHTAAEGGTATDDLCVCVCVCVCVCEATYRYIRATRGALSVTSLFCVIDRCVRPAGRRGPEAARPRLPRVSLPGLPPRGGPVRYT